MATGDILNMLPDEVLPEKDVSSNIPSLTCQEIKKRNEIIFSNDNVKSGFTSKEKNGLNFQHKKWDNKSSPFEIQESVTFQESHSGDKYPFNDSKSTNDYNLTHSMENSLLDQHIQNGFTTYNNTSRLKNQDYLNSSSIGKEKNLLKLKNRNLSESDQHKTNNGISQVKKYKKRSKESFEEVPLITAMMTYLGFYLLMFLGYMNQIFFPPKVSKEENRDGYVPLYDAFESFYLRYVYRRVRDCWNKPICSVPGAEVILKDRITNDYGWTFEYPGTTTKCLNLGSYNYLGFAQEKGPCADAVHESIKKYGIATCSSNYEIGVHPLIVKLEKLTAQFLGVEDALVCGMGFATNALNLPTLIDSGCLVLSDEKNHASVILGLRLSGATIKVFRHNDVKSLENILSEAIIYGHPRTRRPWKKVLIVVEGVYSMEGSIVNLPEIIEIKKKYKAYLYLDEAHSIGAIGPNGRGVVDYYGLDPKDVDILMGTFTKSFGSAGGYLAGSKEIIDYIRVNSHATYYASSMSPPVTQQIITSMEIIMGLDGTDDGKKRIRQLLYNTRYFRQRLHKMGVIIYGNEDSPVIPLLVYMFSKIGAVVRTLCARKIATVGVGFPATPLMEGRIRFCLSAAHTKEQLDNALDVIGEIADTLGLKYSQKPRVTKEIIYGELNEEED